MDLLEYFSSLNPMTFLNALPGNIAQGIIWGIMALGVYITFRLLNFADLTVDGSFATGGAVTCMMLMSGCPGWLTVICAFAAGILAGLVTGLLHTLLGIPDILSGILVQIALYSINLHILGQANRAISADKYKLILATEEKNMSASGLMISLREVYFAIIIALIFAAILIALMYWYFGTEQGSSIRAIGSNPKMATAQGININFYKVVALALSNGVVALAGSLFSQYQGYSDINMGRGSIVIGLAAVIIGQVIGEAIFRKKFNFVMRLLFVLLGGILYYIVIGFVLWLKMPTDDMKLFTAIIVAIFLAVPYLRGKRKSSFSRVVRMNKKMAAKEVEEDA